MTENSNLRIKISSEIPHFPIYGPDISIPKLQRTGVGPPKYRILVIRAEGPRIVPSSVNLMKNTHFRNDPLGKDYRNLN